MFKFTVRPDGQDSYELTATSRDVYVWERTTKNAAFNRLETDLLMADLYKIAFLSAQRQGHWDGTQQQFEQSCDLELVADQDGEADPTQPAP
jgi:hypothetical protein